MPRIRQSSSSPYERSEKRQRRQRRNVSASHHAPNLQHGEADAQHEVQDYLPENPAQTSFFKYLTLLYVAFIVLASLYPFTGWRTNSPDAIGFLFEKLDLTMMRYNRLDLLFNIIAYIPLGMLMMLSQAKQTRIVACVVSIIFAIGLSVLMETLQSFLPSRTSSTFDVICNGLGGVTGALAMTVPGVRQVILMWVGVRRYRFLKSGHLTTLGLMLFFLLFFIQFTPEGGLFALGDFELLHPSDTDLYPPAYFVRAEACVCALSMVAIGLICSCLSRSAWPRALAFCVFIITILVKIFAFWLYFGWRDALLWLTPGAEAGFICGIFAFSTFSFFRWHIRMLIASGCLVLSVILVNYFPLNPYVNLVVRGWHPGNYAYLTNISCIISIIWPFLMMGYLALYGKKASRIADS